MPPEPILLVSILLQFTAAGLALRLIWTTGWRLAWSLIAVAMVLMGARRSITYFNILNDDFYRMDLSAELVALAISALMVAGVSLIGTLFTAVRRAREDTQQGRKLLEAIVDTVPAMINAKDLDSRYTFINRFQAKLYGTSSDAALGRTAAELLSAGYGDYTAGFDRRVIETGKALPPFEETYADAAGVEHTWLTAKVPLKDEQGRVTGIVSVAQEITERKKAEEELRKAHDELEARVHQRTEQLTHELNARAEVEKALRDSEARYRDMLDAGSDWVWEMGPDLRFTYFSDSIFAIIGVEPKALIGKSRPDYAAVGEDAAKWTSHLDDLENHRPFRDFQYELTRPDGATQHIKINGKPIFDDAGAFQGYRGTGTNVSAQVEAERLAAGARRQLMDAIDSIPSMVVLFDAEERFVVCNRHYRDTLTDIADILKPGITFPDICRFSAERGLVAGYQDKPEEWVRIRVERFRNPGEPVLHRQKDGRWVLTYDYKTKEGGTIILRTDVTELKQAQEQLQLAKNEADLANRAKSEFLANMSHELRTPLNAIIGFSSTMKEKIFGPLANEKYEEYVGNIQESGEHLLQLINDILDVSVIEAGQLKLDEKEVDVVGLAAASLRLVKGRAELGRVRVSSHIGDGLPALLGDERRLKQILLNLLTNAIKFTPEGGRVSLAARLDGDGSLALSVADTGIGMTARDMTKALQPFGQGERLADLKHEGIGLGLPVTKGLVEAHGGTLSIDSAPEHGTTVTVRFPAERLVF